MMDPKTTHFVPETMSARFAEKRDDVLANQDPLVIWKQAVVVQVEQHARRVDELSHHGEELDALVGVERLILQSTPHYGRILLAAGYQQIDFAQRFNERIARHRLGLRIRLVNLATDIQQRNDDGNCADQFTDRADGLPVHRTPLSGLCLPAIIP